jgi:hypothetical protein
MEYFGTLLIILLFQIGPPPRGAYGLDAIKSTGAAAFLRARPCRSGHPSLGRTASQLTMIRKLKSGEYRLYSRNKSKASGKRRNLGTFDTIEKAKQHEREIQYFKRH